MFGTNPTIDDIFVTLSLTTANLLQTYVVPWLTVAIGIFLAIWLFSGILDFFFPRPNKRLKSLMYTDIFGKADYINKADKEIARFEEISSQVNWKALDKINKSDTI